MTVAKAYALLQSIRNKPSHTYYKDAGNINLLEDKAVKLEKIITARSRLHHDPAELIL